MKSSNLYTKLINAKAKDTNEVSVTSSGISLKKVNRDLVRKGLEELRKTIATKNPIPEAKAE